MSDFRAARARSAVIALLASVVAAVPAAGQSAGQRCQNIELVQRGQTTRRRYVQQPDGSAVVYAGGGIIVLCRTEGIRLVADSAEQYQASEIVYLFGNVRYTEKGTEVDARRITYWK